MIERDKQSEQCRDERGSNQREHGRVVAVGPDKDARQVASEEPGQQASLPGERWVAPRALELRLGVDHGPSAV